MRPALGDQQLIIHAFAPIDGEGAAEGYAELSRIWGRCRALLGVDVPIIGLPHLLPETLPEASAAGGSAGGPAGVLAALEDREPYRQMIVRRVQNIVNFSMVFTDRAGTAAKRRIGAVSPPGWVEFDRWWDEVAAEGPDPLLGLVRLYLATTTGDHGAPMEVADAVRAAVPSGEQGWFWWERGQSRMDTFALWEWSPEREPRAQRRIVVVGRAAYSALVSDWVWSTGEPTLPPLARYLMHAAQLRGLARAWGDRAALDQQLGRVNNCLEAAREPGDPDAAQRLSVERNELSAATLKVQLERESVHHAMARMDAALHEPLRSDRALAQRLLVTLDETKEDLDAAMRAAARVVRSPGGRSREQAVRSGDPNRAQTSIQVLEIVEGLRAADGRDTDRAAGIVPAQRVDPVPPAGPVAAQDPSGSSALNGHLAGDEPPVLIRMGFGVDVVGYSRRSFPEMEAVQRRLAVMMQEVLADIGVRLADTDHQSQGDSVKVFLPATVEVHKAVPRLLRGWPEQLDRDNRRHEDRIRVRMSVGVGPIGVAALGFAGGTPVEIARLLDCDLLRQAVIDHPESDLVVLVSDKLHQWAILEWQPGAAPTGFSGPGHEPDPTQQFQRVHVVARSFDEDAWLWIASPSRITPS